MTIDLLDRYPSVRDLRHAAEKRMPHFAWAHLEGGTGEETALRENRAALNAIRIVPRVFGKDSVPDLTTELFGQTFQAPFGIAPIGLTGLMWPDGERMLARTAAEQGIPYCLSCVACETPEVVGPLTGGRPSPTPIHSGIPYFNSLIGSKRIT